MKLKQKTTLKELPWLGLRLCTSSAGDEGSIPGGGKKIPHAAGRSQEKKKKRVLSNKGGRRLRIRTQTSEQDRGRYES